MSDRYLHLTGPYGRVLIAADKIIAAVENPGATNTILYLDVHTGQGTVTVNESVGSLIALLRQAAQP